MEVEAEFLCMVCEYRFPPGPMKPCPRCGDTHRMNARYRIEMRMSTPGKAHDGSGHNAKHQSVRKRSVNRDTGHLFGEYRVVDRRNDRYYEFLIDTVTGETRVTDEPLSEHRRRGSARKESPPSPTA